jgi:YVTN family beta-propeller protein
VAACVAALAAAGVAVVLAVAGGGDDKQQAAATTPPAGPSELPSSGSPAPTPPQQNAPGTRIKVGSDPLGVVFRGDSIWVSNTGDGTVTRVATDDNHTTTVPVGDSPGDAASNTSSVWVANTGSDSVTRIDAANGKPGPELPVGPSPYDLTAEEDFVYVSNSGDDTVTVLNAKGGDQVGNPIPVGHDPRGITTSPGPRIVWVADSGDGTVTAIAGNKPAAAIHTGAGAANVAFGAGSLWVSNEEAGTVSRVSLSTGSDLSTMSVRSTRVGSKPFQISYGEGFVWVAVSGDDVVVKLDPKTGNRVGKPISVPGRPVGITARDGAVWVTSADTGTLTRLEP